MKNSRFCFVLPLVLFILVFSLTVLNLSAQQTTQSTQDQTSPAASPSENAPASSQDFSGTNFLGADQQPAAEEQGYPQQASEQPSQAVPGAAPVLGHPLDPADVDTLTGKNDQRRQVGPAGGAYYGYPMTNDWFGIPQFGTQFWGTPGSRFGSPFMTGAFGRGFRGRHLGRFGTSTVFLAAPAGTSFFLGGPHFATPGMFAPGRNWNFGVPPQANFTGSQFGPRHQP